jgi:hypothetical protein
LHIFASRFRERFVTNKNQEAQLEKNLFIKIYCGVEQLVARRAHNPEVACSSHVPATKYRVSVKSESDEPHSVCVYSHSNSHKN